MNLEENQRAHLPKNQSGVVKLINSVLSCDWNLNFFKQMLSAIRLAIQWYGGWWCSEFINEDDDGCVKTKERTSLEVVPFWM